MAKATNRFKVVSSSELVVLEVGKSALKVELQFGKDNQPPELVVAEMYWKDSTEWAYTRSQVRVPATKELAKYLIDGINAAYKESLKVKKDVVETASAVDVSRLSEEEAKALELLLKKAQGFESVLTKSSKKGGKK